MSWDMLYHVIRWNVKDPIRLLKPVIQFVLSVAEKTSRVVRRRFFFSNRRSAPRPFKDIFSAESLASEEIYSRDTKTHVSGLSREESARFENNGWIGPFTFLEPKGIQIIGKIHDQVVRKFNSPGKKYAEPGFILKHPWIKSMHAYVPEFYDITRHPAIVNRVASILGPDIIAWGFSMNEYPPGKVHRWHVDIEHRRWRGVTVFLGLRNITMESTLKVISASHRIKELPQNIGARDDESALALALRYEKASELVPVPVGEGDFFLMAFFGMDRRIGVIALDPPSLFSIRGRINGWKCRWTGMGPFNGPQLGRPALWLVGKTDGESINWSTAPRGPLGIELSAGWRYTTK